MIRHLHVISFDVPYPANYGGVIDVYYKIKALRDLGVTVHLHCFEYRRPKAKELEQICEEVHYYQRKTTRSHLFRRKPFIAVTRTSEKLLNRLLQDDFPILFEGLHSCYHLSDERLVERFKIVRTHNIEHDYYNNLAKVEKDFFKKYYFLNEVGKLQRFERTLCNAQLIAAISGPDTSYLNARYPNVNHISAFHPNDQIDIDTQRGDFCLYHGNLEVGENNEAALYLVKDVFSNLNIPLVIAGNRPSKELKEEVSKFDHIDLKVGLKTDEIHQLIKEAQINVLPTFQSTGIKLKLLAALYTGKHCIVNSPMVQNTRLESLCRVEDSSKRFASAVKVLFEMDFDSTEISKRKAVLNGRFCNKVNAKELVSLIYENGK